jgi:hypothetical protein
MSFFQTDYKKLEKKIKKMENYYEYENICRTLNTIYPLVLIPIGTIFNFICLFIFTRNEFFKTSTGFYYSFSSIVDTLLLYFGSFKFFLAGIIGTNPELFSDFNCKFLQYSVYTLAYISAWNLVIISFDRLFLVLNVLIQLKKKKFQILIVLLLVSFFCLINTPMLVFIKLDENKTKCQTFDPYYNFLFLNIFDLLFSCVIPFVLVISNSLYIITRLHKSKRRVFDKNHSFRITKHNIIIIFVRGIIFLFLNTPVVAFTFGIIKSDQTGLNNLFYVIGNVVFYVNYTVTFFVHFIMNKAFREKFLKTIKK